MKKLVLIAVVLVLSISLNAQSVGINATGEPPNNDAMLEVVQTKASGNVFGVYGSATGAATTNYGAYFSASGATKNHGLVVPSGNVGIGTASPHSLLSLGMANTNSQNRIAIYEDPDGYYFFGIGMANPDLIGDTHGLGFWSNTSNLYPTDQNMDVFIRDDGNVGIGTTNPCNELLVVGDIGYTGTLIDYGKNGTLTNKEKLTNVLPAIMNLNPITFQMVNPKNKNTLTDKKTGFDINELELMLPQIVKTANDKAQTKGISYLEMIPVLTKAIQEQQQTIEAQQKQIKELKAQNAALTIKTESIDQLRAEIEDLKKLVQTNYRLTDNK